MNLVYTVTLADDTSLPASISFATNTVTVQTNDFSGAILGTFTVKVTAKDTLNGFTPPSQTFVVRIKCTKTIAVAANPIPASFEYVFNEPTLTTGLPTYSTNAA